MKNTIRAMALALLFGAGSAAADPIRTGAYIDLAALGSCAEVHNSAQEGLLYLFSDRIGFPDGQCAFPKPMGRGDYRATVTCGDESGETYPVRLAMSAKGDRLAIVWGDRGTSQYLRCGDVGMLK